MLRLSQSKAKTWRQCRQAYWFKYTEGLRKKKKRRPLQFGSVIHSMLEGYAEGEDPFDVLKEIDKKNGKMFRAEIEELGDIIGDAEIIMREYFDFWGKDEINHLKINGKYSEHTFEVEIAKGIMATGKIDAIAKYKKQRVLGEHKTFSRAMSEDDRWRNLQSNLYMHVVDILGWKPLEGTLWDNVRSKAPAMPEPLKSGALSKARIDTLPSQYLKAIQKNGLDVKDYGDVLDVLYQNRSQWFIRYYTPRNNTTVKAVVQDFIDTGNEITRDAERRPICNIGIHCGMCDYEPLCRARFQNLDVDYIKEREYTHDREEELREASSD